MSDRIQVPPGHVTVTCTLCPTTIVVPYDNDPHKAATQALELHLYHRIHHHEEEQ